MIATDQDRDRDRLAVILTISHAIDQKHQVVDAVSSSSTAADAIKVVGRVLGVDDDLAWAVLDMQMGRLTKESRDGFLREASMLRSRLGEPDDFRPTHRVFGAQ